MKPWYKKFKVLVGIATAIIEIAILITASILGTPLSAGVLLIMKYVFALAIAIISGHSITDALSALKKK